MIPDALPKPSVERRPIKRLLVALTSVSVSTVVACLDWSVPPTSAEPDVDAMAAADGATDATAEASRTPTYCASFADASACADFDDLDLLDLGASTCPDGGYASIADASYSEPAALRVFVPGSAAGSSCFFSRGFNISPRMAILEFDLFVEVFSAEQMKIAAFRYGPTMSSQGGEVSLILATEQAMKIEERSLDPPLALDTYPAIQLPQTLAGRWSHVRFAVTLEGAGHGSAASFVDNTRVQTVDLASPSNEVRVLVAPFTFVFGAVKNLNQGGAKQFLTDNVLLYLSP